MQNSIREANRRRIYYIKKDFQRKFILIYITMVLVGTAFSYIILYSLLNKGIDDVFYRAHVRIITTGDVTWSPLILTGLTIVAVASLAVLGFTIFNSRRIGRSLSCLAEGVKGIKSGDLTVMISASQRDDLSDLADTFNEAVSSLNNKVASTKAKINELEQAALAIQPENAGSVDLLLSRIDSIEKELSAFKIQGIGCRV